MRSEHRTTGDEWDFNAYYRDKDGKKVYYYGRGPGVRREVKRTSHRLDRAVKKRKIEEEMRELE